VPDRDIRRMNGIRISLATTGGPCGGPGEGCAR
jgi:hypothetical protein